MAKVRNAVYLVILAIVAPYLYDRYVTFTVMFSNRPARLQHDYKFKSHEIKFSNQIRNCEDIILEEELGIAFIGCDPGRDRWNTVMGTFHPPHPNKHEENNGKIWIYNYANPGVEALTPLTGLPTDFHPLGLAFDAPTSTLYVINHSRHSGSVLEIFKVSLSTHSAKHIQTFTHPLLHAPNALHLLGNRKMYITNDHYMRAATSPLLSKIETFANIPGGSVVYVDLDAPAQAKVVARIGFANGVAKVNASTLVVASSSKPGLYFFDIAADHGLVQKAFVRTPASADNLSVDGKGKVLIAGHPFAPQLMSVAKGRVGCEVEGDAQCACGAPSWVGEWSEAEGLRTLLMSGGEEGICSSSTAVRDVERGVGMVSMLYGRGVVVFKE